MPWCKSQESLVQIIEQIIEREYVLSDNLLYYIMSNKEVNDDNKKKLLIYHLDSLSITNIVGCMSLAGFTDFVSLFDGKRPKILHTEENYKLLSYFHKKGCISSFDRDPKDSEYYRVIGKKYIDNPKSTVPVELL